MTAGGAWDAGLPLDGSLLEEGTAMRDAVLADLESLRVPFERVRLMRDSRCSPVAASGIEVAEVSAAGQHDAFFRESVQASDVCLLIAPETDGILLRLASKVDELNGKRISPGPDLIAIAGDKSRAAAVLNAAHVPTPPGVSLEADQRLPADFSYPAVLKPRDGAGSSGIHTVLAASDLRAPAASRLEARCPGAAVSVSFLCGPAGSVPLPPCHQRLSEDGCYRYLGGTLPLAEELADRAVALGLRALAALPATVGYVGIDLLLGEPGCEWVVDINPRLTTSYVGLRHAVRENLLDAMWEVAHGRRPRLSSTGSRLEFQPDGRVFRWQGTSRVPLREGGSAGRANGTQATR